MTSIAKEEQIANQPNSKEEIVYLTVPVEYLTVPVAYKIRSLLNALEPLAEAADNKDLKELIDAVNTVLYERYGDFIEDMDGIKKLPSIEILNDWFHMYCGFLDNSWGIESYDLMLLLASELADRGLGRYTEKIVEAAAEENINQELSDSECEEFADYLSGMTEAEKLQEWDFYTVILDLCNHRNVKDRQRRDMIFINPVCDGLKKIRRKYSLRSCN